MAYNSNRISLGGNVELRDPLKRDIATEIAAFNRLGDQIKEANQQAAKTQIDLSNVKLNPAEDGWKHNYEQKIQDKFNTAIAFGDFNSIPQIAKEAATSKDLIGRAINEGKIDKYEDELHKRVIAGKVDADVEEAWKLDNKPTYKSTDITDSDGNIIGVNDWKPYWQVLDKVDSPTKIKEVFDYMSAEKGGKEWQTGTYDEKDETRKGGGRSFDKKTKQRFIPLLRERFIEDSEWRNALIQEQTSANILLKDIEEKLAKETDPDKIKALKAKKEVLLKKAADEDGKIIKDPFDFLQNKYKETINSLPYDYETTNDINITSPRSSKKSEDVEEDDPYAGDSDIDKQEGEETEK